MTERQGQTEGQKGLKGKLELVPFEDLLSFDVGSSRSGRVRTGPSGSSSPTPGAGSRGVWFIALSTIAPEVLQTALVAVAHGLVVGVLVTGTSDRSEIYRFQVKAA